MGWEGLYYTLLPPLRPLIFVHKSVLDKYSPQKAYIRQWSRKASNSPKGKSHDKVRSMRSNLRRVSSTVLSHTFL